MSEQAIKAFQQLQEKGLLTAEQDYAPFLAGFKAARDALGAQLREAENLADQWAEKNAALCKEAEALRAENEQLRERIAALEAECERLADALDRQSVITGDYIARCQRLADELAITRRVIDRIGQLCTTPHESKERFIRRVQSVIEWERAAQQDQPK